MSPGLSLSPEEIISAALVKYTNLTDQDLVNDSLANEIKSCDSPSAIRLVFQQHTRAFDDDDVMLTCLHVIVDNLQALSITPALSEVAGLQAVCLLKYAVYITILKCYFL
jgi:hypothetical protein